jgi:ribosomal protein S18 acetylase RimI-like enzyme
VSIVRTAGPEDAAALAALEERTYVASLAHVFGDHPYPSDDVLARWSVVLADTDVRVLAVWEQGELAGYAAVDPGSLRHLAVAPERFGTGLADELHAAAVEHWADHGARRVQLWVLADNTRARRFYARHGWSDDGREQRCPWPPWPTEVGMTRTLVNAAPKA